MKKLISQFLIILIAIFMMGLWQARSLPSGLAPQESLFQLNSNQPSQLPANPESKSGVGVQLLYFFAPWCSVCRISGPNALLTQRLMADLSVKFIALDFERVTEVAEFSDQVGLGQNVFLGTETTKKNWRVSAYPTYVIVGEDGVIHSASVGYSTTFGIVLRILWVKLVG